MIKLRIKDCMFTAHKIGLRFGVAVLPNHYYTSVPDLTQLARTRSTWARSSEMVGLDVDLDRQLNRVEEICLRFEPEYRGNAPFLRGSQNGFGPGFGYIEAQALHSVIRHFQPANIIEIGSGVSTYCMLEASALNRAQGGRAARISAIEPFPSEWLNNAAVELAARPVQEINLDLFKRLGRGDLLFIDSSHSVKTGSDTNFLILEVLPRLNPGVIVHFHDIYLPYEYPRDALKSFIHSQETALLHAFLIANSRFRILFCLSMLHYGRREELRRIFPEYRPQADCDGMEVERPARERASSHFPSSVYLEVLG